VVAKAKATTVNFIFLEVLSWNRWRLRTDREPAIIVLPGKWRWWWW